MTGFDWDGVDFAVDTAGSTDGGFPEPGPDCYFVEVSSPFGDYPLILVSSRYTGACDDADAATMAVSVWSERNPEVGELAVGLVTGGPFYHVRVWRGNEDHSDGRDMIVRLEQDGYDMEWTVDAPDFD